MKLNLEVLEGELEKRRKAWTPIINPADKGYVKMFTKHVEQAEKGYGFDFLVGGSGSEVFCEPH